MKQTQNWSELLASNIDGQASVWRIEDRFALPVHQELRPTFKAA